MGAKREAGLEAVGAHLLSATRVALSTARTLTDINTGELVTAKVKSAVYNKAQEKEPSSCWSCLMKPGSCDLTIADDKLEWRYALLAGARGRCIAHSPMTSSAGTACGCVAPRAVLITSSTHAPGEPIFEQAWI
jgi:hypothetical protein